MREYRPYKHQMGVEGPSFYREQQERRRQEQEARESQGRDQPKTQGAAPKQQASMWDVIYGPAPEEKVAPAPPVSPAFQRRGLSPEDPGRWFKMPEIWAYVGETRGYGVPAFAVDILTRATLDPIKRTVDLGQSAGEIVQFFGIPASAFQGLSLDDSWKQVIGPFLESLEQGMSRMKPIAIPGALRFELDDEGKLLLVYRDR